MQIVAHTERGFFVSKTFGANTDEDRKTIEKWLSMYANGEAGPMKLPTDAGYILIGKELLEKSVFVVTE